LTESTERTAWWPGDTLLGDKVALVAGGGRGIGEATSRILAAAGAAVAVLDLEADRANFVAASLRADGATAIPVVADLRVEDDCERAASTVASELGRLDVLANIAGGMNLYAKWRHLEEWSTADWDMIVHLNLRYIFWLSRSVIPRMRSGGGGSIINVTSISGVFGAPNHAAYGAAKAGLIHLTKTLAVECGSSGIRVNAVSPGAVVSPAQLVAGTMTPERQALFGRNLPSRRPGVPEDIARAILYFASPMSDQVTGQMLLVDGGSSSKFPVPVAGTEPWEASQFG
jgi:3-oxoacyl-[acyl-carrier protein] reductase